MGGVSRDMVGWPNKVVILKAQQNRHREMIKCSSTWTGVVKVLLWMEEARGVTAEGGSDFVCKLLWPGSECRLAQKEHFFVVWEILLQLI